LAGRIIEKVTGQTYENAIASLLLKPIGLEHSFFQDSAIMTRRFAVGHNPDADHGLAVARNWKRWRSNNPGGGLVSSVSDQIRWARFHLGHGRAVSGEQVWHLRERCHAVRHRGRRNSHDARGRAQTRDPSGVSYRSAP
jgi:CubicO group peptidase (beta-lactamase class C family)